MITRQNKIDIITKRIDNLQEQVSLINFYIDKINEGMEDSDQPLGKYQLLLQEVNAQIWVLTQYREML